MISLQTAPPLHEKLLTPYDTAQAPSETLEDIFNWYEWDHNSLARQGLFLVISSSDLQRDSAYRLFIAGALVGLGGGFLVLGIQYVFEAIVPAQRNIDRH